ncbi:MAG: DUF378 domain-containing protein [bacterium]|nr:DUF378 domain-containing protein [bacterium]
MTQKGTLGTVAFWLTVVGGLNWGLAVFQWNLVESLLGGWPALVTTVYALVGLSALYLAFGAFKKG